MVASILSINSMFVLTVKLSLFVIEDPRHWLGFDDSAILQASSFSECLRCAKLPCCPTDHISAPLLSLLFVPLFTVYLMINADAAPAISHDLGILKISSDGQNAPQKGGSYIIVLVSSLSPSLCDLRPIDQVKAPRDGFIICVKEVMKSAFFHHFTVQLSP